MVSPEFQGANEGVKMKSKLIVTMGLVGVLFINPFYGAAASDSAGVDNQSGSTQECRLAISIGEKFLSTIDTDPANYKLIEARNLIIRGNEEMDPRKWRLTFKDRAILPTDKGGILGVGGEIFIEVDVGTQQAKLLGVGE